MYQLLKMEVQPFDAIHEVAARACKMAYRNDQPVRFKFNGIGLNVGYPRGRGFFVSTASISDVNLAYESGYELPLIIVSSVGQTVETPENLHKSTISVTRRYARNIAGGLMLYVIGVFLGMCAGFVLGSAWGSAVQRRRCLEAFDEMDVQLTETRRRVCRAEAVLSQMRQFERHGEERYQGVN
mgnify:CR=1 FL=1